MEIKGRSVLLLGGSGLVGMAIARQLAVHHPAQIVICGLTRAEAEGAIAELRAEQLSTITQIDPEWGDIFLPVTLKDHSRREVLEDEAARGDLIDDLYGELNQEVVLRSALGALLLRRRPEIVIDCVNTATAFAYQNVFDLATSLRATARAEGLVSREQVERMLATLYFPQLIRHVQIALEGMRRARTQLYLKIGTSGTGGMGLNIPFTHSEERPSRMLLAKSGVAGAQTLLLYLMARTPDAPAVKEIKPTAAISWKRIAHGPILRRGQAVACVDCTEPLPVAQSFAADVANYRETGETLSGVFLDAGENGLFSLGEFEVLTALGLMEYITPEEIADDVLREITGHPTGHDVVAAIDAATSGPTYRAGVLREVAMERMAELEREHQVESVAYEMLGPPRLSKLLFEGAILGRLYESLAAVAAADPEQTAHNAGALVLRDRDLRVRMLSIGLPIVLPDGRLLRGAEVKVAPAPGQAVMEARLVENGWVDLRAANWRKWQQRARAMLEEINTRAGPDRGSRFDNEPGSRRLQLRPGRMAAWIFRSEDRGQRVKR